MYYQEYKTRKEFDDILLLSDGTVLTGLWFKGSKDAEKQKEKATLKVLPIFHETKRWLDHYFDGKPQDTLPPYRLDNVTSFQKEVLEILEKIPYGTSMTYGEIANILARKRGIARMSAQAVGGAVGANPISILIPCHRVLGSKGKLTGYGGGLSNKMELLKLEKIPYQEQI